MDTNEGGAMNVGQLHNILRTLRDDLEQYRVRELFQAISQGLSNAISNPGAPQYQETVAADVVALQQALEQWLEHSYPAQWNEYFTELGLRWALPGQLNTALSEAFLTASVIPSEALRQVQSVSETLDELVRVLDGQVAGLAYLNADRDQLGPYEFELVTLVPRTAVNDELGQLGLQFQQIARLIGPFDEVATGSRPPVEVRSIASSQFLVYVELVAETATLLSMAIDAVVGVYERVNQLKALLVNAEENGASPQSVASLEADARKLADDNVPEIVDRVLATADRAIDEGREVELRLELDKSVRGLMKRFDQKFVFEVRVGPGATGDDPDAPSPSRALAKARTTVLELQSRVKAFEGADRPILELMSGDEGLEELVAKAPAKKRLVKPAAKKAPAKKAATKSPRGTPDV